MTAAAVAALRSYVSELQNLPPVPEYEPEIDDKDEKKDKELR